MKIKCCNKCYKIKIVSEFNKSKFQKYGVDSVCKKCTALTQYLYFKKFPEKRIYHNMVERCTNPKNSQFKDYGGRGIKILLTEKEIRKLMERDNYWNLKKPSINRKDNNGNYTVDNCEFIEKGLNSAERNTRVLSKPIFQLSLNNVFIKEWESIKRAE